MKYFISVVFAFTSIAFAASNQVMTNGKAVYEQHCAACHNVGTATAPLLSNSDYWQTLLKTSGSSSKITATVISGKGAMPAKGGCANCTEADLRDAVEFMLADNPKAEKTEETPKTDLPLNLLKLPKGFHISVYADDVPGARELALGNGGIVYVGTRGQGKIYALLPNKTFSHAKKILTIADDLNEPNGVAFHDGALYVAEVHQVLKYADITAHLSHPQKPTVINNSFPNRRWHGYKYIKFGPNGDLYIAVGMPCNTCNYRKKQPMFGTIMKMKPNGKGLTIYAKGIRNSVGFDWSPVTKSLWFTDNGQDMLGDNLPPDEINRAPHAGMDFGFPFFYGNNIPAPGYTSVSDKSMTVPAYNLPAHVAPLGLQFYTGKQFPRAYQNQIFIAEHGSWNRSSKVGYQVIMASVREGKVTHVRPFITGWLQGEKTWGRPVDLLTLPNGSLLISDDYAGVVYRVAYK